MSFIKDAIGDVLGSITGTKQAGEAAQQAAGTQAAAAQAGLALVGELAKVLAGSQTEIVAASLKSRKEAVDAFLAGAQHITVPCDLLANLSIHPLSVQTVDQFNAEGIGICMNS